MGSSVNLPPAVVLLAALAGAKMAGIVGIILAAPVLGSARVLGSWTFHQLTRSGESSVDVFHGDQSGVSDQESAAEPLRQAAEESDVESADSSDAAPDAPSSPDIGGAAKPPGGTAKPGTI